MASAVVPGPAALVSVRQLLARVRGGAHRGGHDRCTGDHETEREEAGGDLE